MSKYLILFQNDFNTDKDFKKAICAAVELYIEENPQTPITEALQKFIRHAKAATDIGHIVIGWPFPEKMDDSLQVLFTVARFVEQSAFNAPSSLVAQCEIKAAQEGHTPQVIFEMCARLEEAKTKQTEPVRYQEEIQDKLNVWLATLYEKFAQLILESKDLADLKEKVILHFKGDLAKGLDSLGEFRQEVDCQIEDFLEGKGFFEQYYALQGLAAQYDYVYEFYQDTKKNGLCTPELKATMTHLFYQILNTAYAPCVQKKFELMRNRSATVSDVYGELKKWAKDEAWKAHESTDLFDGLFDKLAKDEETEMDWHLVSSQVTEKVLPAYQVFSFKYAGDPKQNPKELLQKLRSPQKKAATSRIPPVQTTPVPSLLSLYYDEEFDPVEPKPTIPEVTSSTPPTPVATSDQVVEMTRKRKLASQ